MNFDPGFLFASMVWGSIGVGLIMYGRKQTAPAPLVAGVILVMASYFSETALGMSVISGITLFAAYRISK